MRKAKKKLVTVSIYLPPLSGRITARRHLIGRWRLDLESGEWRNKTNGPVERIIPKRLFRLIVEDIRRYKCFSQDGAHGRYYWTRTLLPCEMASV